MQKICPFCNADTEEIGHENKNIVGFYCRRVPHVSAGIVLVSTAAYHSAQMAVLTCVRVMTIEKRYVVDN